MREFSPAQNDSAINKKPAEANESFTSSLRQHAVDAWQEIGNLTKNQQAQMSGRQNQNSDFLTFDLIYRDDDSLTRCRGYSGPKGDKLSCVTKDLPDKNEKPLCDKKDNSLRQRQGELQPQQPPERLPIPNMQVPNLRQNPDSPQTTTRGNNARHREEFNSRLIENQRTR